MPSLKFLPKITAENRSYYLAALIAVIALLWIGSGLVGQEDPKVDQREQSTQEQGQAQDEENFLVRTKAMQAETYTNIIDVTGRTQAFRKSQIAAEINGRVIETPLEEGAHVNKGDVILSLEDDDRRALLTQAEQALEQARIEYEASRKLTQRQFNSEIRLATTKAALESARANLKRAQINVDNLNIKAPYDGVFEARLVELGDFVQTGEPVAEFVDLDPIKIVGFVTEKQISHITVGAPADIKLLDGRDVKGRVSFIASVADEQARTFRIEMQANNSDMNIIEGLTAEIQIEGDQYQAYQVSPSVLTLADDGRVGVKIVDANHIVHFKPVHIISDRTDGMWITGLPEAIQLITVGQEFVRDGQMVRDRLLSKDEAIYEDEEAN